MEESGIIASKSLVPKTCQIFLYATAILLATSKLITLLFFIDPRLEAYSHKEIKNNHCSADLLINSTICTEGCQIPLLTMDEDLIRKLEIHETPLMKKLQSCKPYPLLCSNKSHIWVEKKNMHYYSLNITSKFSCCYRSFYSHTLNSPINQQIKYSDCREFTDTINVNNEDEFVRVTCRSTETLFDSFFAFATEKEVSKCKDLPYNILILGIDAVSRLNFHRTMPKTVEYLKKLDAVEFLGYNKLGSNTFPNVIAMLMGIDHTEIENAYFSTKIDNWTLDPYPFIWKSFQEAGFVTAFAEDWGTFNDEKRGFQQTPTHYYLDPFIKEAALHAGNNRFEKYTICMNEKFFFQILLDYVEDLTTLKNKLFGVFWESTMSHDFLAFPTVMDDSYSEFFKRLHTSGYLNDTIIFLTSDHGIRYGAFRRTKQGFLEERLPFMFALMPPSFRANFNEAYKNLKLNGGRLTTPFDMHATLTDLLDLETISNDKIVSRSKASTSEKGVSLFLPISEQRTCKSAGIDDQWCTCNRNAENKLDNSLANRAVHFAVDHLNHLLSSHPQCAKLRLAKTLEVAQLLSEELSHFTIELFASFQTAPGAGIFEAKIIGRGWSGAWFVSGPVSRVNRYGNQSDCMPYYQLAPFCYCVEG